jgi:acetyl-CoA synthetase
MPFETIHKDPAAFRVPPNLSSYEEERANFTWERARSGLDGMPGGGLNIAYEAVDRHAIGPRAGKVALRTLDERGHATDLSYAELCRQTNQFANLLKQLGVGRGDTVFTLLGRVPQLYVTVLGALKNASVVSPLFSAFGPDPVCQRLQLGDGRVLVTTALQYKRKVAPRRHELPGLKHVLLVDGDRHPTPGTLDLNALLAEATDEFEVVPTQGEDLALLHFTSGTTGTPKGAMHVHGAVLTHYVSGRYALDLHSDDIYWCTADPGWVTGTSYGIIAPLTNGLTMIVDSGEFDARRWYRTLAEQGVTVWYTAPTALRMLARAGEALTREQDLSKLRFVASVGEALNPEVVVWGQETLGLPIHDNWWQTETGGIMIANFAATEIRPGSMGRPLPGIDATVLARGQDGRALVQDGRVREVTNPGDVGELALRAGWPSMFRGYLNDEARYSRCFADGWYLTGDLASRDADGFFWFVGRADDVIKSAGHLIGPFEVESALMEHPDVAEAGVIGRPDPVAGEVVKAFVTLRPGIEPSEQLRLELVAFARKRLGPAVAPREIVFDAHLPKTRSGKIMRRLLKARELGLPEGDLSTLEELPTLEGAVTRGSDAP